MRINKNNMLSFTNGSPLPLPLFAFYVPAGFPSPADDYLEGTLDLNEHLIKRPAATFFVRAQGQSMLKAGIHDGDLLLVDRKLFAKNGSIVVASLHGELTVKRLRYGKDGVYLCPEHDDYTPMLVTDTDHFVIWGVVTNAIHCLL